VEPGSSTWLFDLSQLAARWLVNDKEDRNHA
jgi:hypothetical protein